MQLNNKSEMGKSDLGNTNISNYNVEPETFSENENLSQKFNTLLQDFCNKNNSPETRNENLANLVSELYDPARGKLNLTQTQFNLLERSMNSFYGNLPQGDQPILCSLKLNYDFRELMELVKDEGKSILTLNKEDFKDAILDYYSNYQYLDKTTEYPFALLRYNKLGYTSEEIRQILVELIQRKKLTYNTVQEQLSFLQTFNFGLLLCNDIFHFDRKYVFELYEYLLKDIIKGNYRKRIAKVKSKNDFETLSSYDEGPNNFLENTISGSLQFLIDRFGIFDGDNKEPVEPLKSWFEDGGLIDQVILTLQKDDAYRFPNSTSGYETYFCDTKSKYQKKLEEQSK